MQQLQKTLTSPAEAAGFLQGSRDSGGSSKDSSCDTDDFVMVPAQFPGDLVAEAAGGKPPPDSLMCSGTSPLGFARASPSPPSHAEHGAALARKLSLGGGRPYTPSPQVGTIPERLGWSGVPSPQGAEMRGGRSPRPEDFCPHSAAVAARCTSAFVHVVLRGFSP
ncbi:Serine/threonine-protein kinase ULK1 [Myotis brandtii]|uniref:Serine/threonine-protein kinase ULK1 n=1 Tax=Myotis brandtii TaxID=109478 RepID=S7PU78_MYOBR|nr:Serine/threonine-protein kinase ULK1 [Myotis brandtii]